MKKKRSSRRSFIRRSLLGALSLSTSGFATAAQKPLRLQPLQFHPSYSDKETLERARKNIPKYRMRDAELTLLGRDGSPLARREVHIRQLKHQFLFGDQNWTMASMFRSGLGESDRLKYYRHRFAEVFNSLTATVYWTERPRNDATKTEDFQGGLRLEDFNESVNWGNANGLTVKGHPLFWPIPKAVPEWVKKYDPETMMKFVEVRVRNLAARYQGKVKAWDAVNEMLWEPAPKNLPARSWPYTESLDNMADYISRVLRWAREEDPNALYTINDYGISQVNQEGLTDQEGRAVTTERQRQRYLQLINRLGEEGCPPNLVGLQSHTGWLKPTEQVALYDELSEAGIPLTVTEFWARLSNLRDEMGHSTAVESEEWRSMMEKPAAGEKLSDEALEEIRDEYVLNYLACAFGHPNIHSFYFWGFMGMAVDFAASPSSSHELRPLYEKVRKLIHEEWHTEMKVKTDSEGRLRFRGFCGDYSASLPPAEGAAPIGRTFTIDKDAIENRFLIRTSI